MSKEEDERKSLDDLNGAQKIFCKEDGEVIETSSDPSPKEESQEEELEHDEELVEYEGGRKEDSDNEDTDSEEEESVTEDSDEQSTEENSDGEDYVVKEIRKRREASEHINSIELDTAMALDVKFSPTKLEVAILFSASLKLYAVEEGALTNIITADIRLPLSAIEFSSSGEDVYGVEGSIFHKFMRNGDNLTVQSIELFEKTISCIQVEGTCAVVGSEEGSIYVFDPETCELVFSVKVNDDAIESISSFGDIAYITSANTVFAISLSRGTVLHKNEYPVDVTHGIIQGNSFVAASAKGELVLFSIPTLNLQGTFRVAKDASVSAMVSINSSHVAVAFDNSSVRLFSLFPNTEVGIIGVLNTFATHLSVSCDGKWLIANDFMDNCHIFSLADVDDAPPECKKRKRSSFSKNLTSSSSEDKEVFFSSLS